jgi:lipoprotein signal peptidase
MRCAVFRVADRVIVAGAGLLVLEIMFHKSSGGEESRTN